MKRFFYAALVMVFLLAVLGIVYGVYLNRTDEQNIASRLDKRALMLTGVKVQRRPIAAVLTSDVATLYTDHMTDIACRVDGVVEEVFVSQGQTVTKGTELMYIANEDIPLAIMRTQGSIAKAQAELYRAERTFERYKTLVAEDAASSQQLDEAEAYYMVAKASIEELNAQQKANYMMKERQSIKSPISGQVLMVYKQPGTFVSAGMPVCLVGDFTKLYFKLSLEDRKIRYLIPLTSPKKLSFNRADFTKAYETNYGAGNIGDRQVFEVTVESVSPPLDVPAKMRSVVFSIDNSSGMLEPQTYRNMEILSGQTSNVLVVPLAAMTDQKRDTVFVWGKDEVLSTRQIVTGEDDGEYIEVISGLSEGEIVITSEQDGLRDGLKADVHMKGSD